MVTDVHRGATVAHTESEELEENYRILAAIETLAGGLALAKMIDEERVAAIIRDHVLGSIKYLSQR